MVLAFLYVIFVQHDGSSEAEQNAVYSRAPDGRGVPGLNSASESNYLHPPTSQEELRLLRPTCLYSGTRLATCSTLCGSITSHCRQLTHLFMPRCPF